MQVDTFTPELTEGVICAGISTLTGEQIKYGLEAAEKIRAINPDIPIVWGGIHPSIIPEQTIQHSLVDYVICGEGEEAFPDFLNNLVKDGNLEDVQNLVYLKDGEPVVNPRRPFLNFNKRNNLPYDLLKLSRYQTGTRIEYQSSRGCPHGCSFCYNKGFNMFKWRFKDPEIVLDELESLKKRFGSEYLFYVDDEFFISKKRATAIIQGLIDRGIDFKWKASIRIEVLNKYSNEMFEMIYKSGCFEMSTGAESGAPKILEFVKKKITVDNILESARHTRESLLSPQYSFMSGFPGETMEDLYMTIDCIDELWKINKKIKINGLFFATPFPGTEFYEAALKANYKPPESLDEWQNIDIIMSYKNVPYISDKFAGDLQIFGFIIQFKYLWMHSATFLSNLGNIGTIKFWRFAAFHLFFKPFDMTFNFRWKKKFTSAPFDVKFMKFIISKIAM